MREGVGRDILGLAVGHVPGTAVPGQPGNVAIAGHRDTLFRGLRGIQKNDVIQFETLDGTYTYDVESTEVVAPEDVSVLKAGVHPELTLVTCYPFNYIGPAPDRFIVKARQLYGILQRNSPAQLAQVRETRDAPPDGAAHPPTDAGRVNFTVLAHHSRQLTPGISIGIDDVNSRDHSVNGWMWLMPDRRTVWLRHQSPQQPLVFYQDGERRELRITIVSDNSASGYVIESPAQQRQRFARYVRPAFSQRGNP